MQLDDTILPEDVLLGDGSRRPHTFSGEELREACRALRGSMLRQEIYGLDASNAEDRPYRVSERSYTIETLQPRGPNAFGVFFVHPRETLDFQYERRIYTVKDGALSAPDAPPPSRTAADPRVSHGFTLSVDSFGNALETVAIAYGRRYRDPALTAEDQDTQHATLGTYIETVYTAPVSLDDAYRAPLVAEAATFELIHVVPDANLADVTNVFGFDEMRAQIASAGDGAHEVPFEAIDPAGLHPGEPYRRLISQTRTLYRPDDLGAAAGDPRALLAPRALESMALPGATFKLAFTPGLIARTYRRGGAALLPMPATVLGSVGPDGGGYVDLDGDGRWWVAGGRIFYMAAAPSIPQEKAQASQHFYLTRRFEDAFGSAATVDYDGHDLLAVATTDEASNTIAAQNDYRVLAPAVLTDANGNRSAVSFDTRGFVTATAVMGKTTESVGDALSGFDADLTQAQIDAFYAAANPHTVAAALLGNATTRLVYDLYRFRSTRAAAPADPSTWQPPFSATITRETHVFALPSGHTSRMQLAFSYSDGYGREIQKKIQAEPGPLVDGGPTVDPRWVGSGWTIFNNKGKPVRQYEPFFSQLATAGHRFEFGNAVGVSPIALYDPIQRPVASLNANHTYRKTVFDPWHQDSWDVNDTALVDPAADQDVGGHFSRLPSALYTPTWFDQRATGALGVHERAAALKAAAHANTPAVAYLDGLGRTFRTTMDNAAGALITARFELDIQGNQRAVVDALDRRVVVCTYDLLQNRIAHSSMDSGESWMLAACSGNAIRAWDSRGHDFRTAYDALRRPIGLFVQGTDPIAADPRTLGGVVQYQKIEYGEGQPHDTDLNLRGRVFRHSDCAGVLTNADVDPATGATEAYDFKGNLLRSRRTFVDDATALPDWAGAPPAASPDGFAAATEYDALNRPVALSAPDGSVIRPTYNQANLLTRVDIHLRGATAPTAFVASVDYNAKGQRLRVDYANQTSTTYTYDPALFRLVRLLTSRQGVPASQQIVQDLSYVFDPVGNITHIQDDADIQNVVFFSNRRVEPSADYTYDAIYRLIEATGREHLGLTAGVPNPPAASSYNDVPRVKRPHPGDGAAMGLYDETYHYDAVSNVERLVHAGTSPVNPGWTRTYTYAEPSLLDAAAVSNRLTATSVSGSSSIAEPLAYDARGNVTSMIQLQSMRWDFKDQLVATTRRAVSGSDVDGAAHQGEQTVYAYDATGQRVRKVTLSAGGTKLRERFYLGGFERYREYGPGALERDTLHVMDDRRRIAIVDTKTADAAAPPGTLPSRTFRYQFDNHLGTACLELDETGAVMSYEEFYPFGGTSYQAGRSLAEVSLKRYRYLGRERDEETGFNYNRARYYAPWMARWISPDPAGLVDGPNPYQYARNNPVMLSDPGGRDPDEGVDVGPFRFRNIQGRANLNLNANFTVNNLFSSDRSLTINSLFAGGNLDLVADTTLTPFGLTGRSTAHLSLDQLHIDHQLFSTSLTANATLASGPFALDLDADLTGTSIIDRNISLSAPADSLRYTLDHFHGSGNVFGRFFFRAGPINRVLGAFSLTADTNGTSGVLSLRGYVGLPTLDPGRNINVARVTGEGTFGPGGYDLHGDFRLILPPVAFATGRFDLNSSEGLSASGHYVGLLVGPLGLTPSIDPLASERPPNASASPGDTETTLSRQLALPERRHTGPAYTVQAFTPGVSIGYSYLHYSRSSTTIFSAGIAPRSTVTTYSLEHPPLPGPLGVIPGLDTLLYGPSPSAPTSVYFGVSLTQSFWAF